MKVIIVGLGVQGKKRMKVAGKDVVATVDPFVKQASHKSIYDVAINSYDAGERSIFSLSWREITYE